MSAYASPAALQVLDLHLSNLEEALTRNWLRPEEACPAISQWIMQAITGQLAWLLPQR